MSCVDPEAARLKRGSVQASVVECRCGDGEAYKANWQPGIFFYSHQKERSGMMLNFEAHAAAKRCATVLSNADLACVVPQSMPMIAWCTLFVELCLSSVLLSSHQFSPI